MKLLTPKTLLSLSSSSSSYYYSSHPYSILISHFSTSSNYHSHSVSRRHEEESRIVKVSVWWDFENCNLPAGVNVFKVAHAITAAIRTNGIKGPIQITAFGDVFQLSRTNQEALSSTGVNITHIPNGGKNSADRSLLVDLMYWVSQNPPPAHLFLISGDRDFASILHRLRMNNYNILLASPETAPGVLCSAASIMWHWNALVRGENLTGKHFNQPPDGPYGSWYGHYKVPLEDPFSTTEQPPCLQTEELSEPGLDAKLRPVPKAVMKQIHRILNFHPKGIAITELRSELSKINFSIDKDFYGYKKFSRLLLSMPHILKLRLGGDGQFVVCAVTPKAPEPIESDPGISRGPVNKNGDKDFTMHSELNGEERPITGAVDEKSTLPLSELNAKDSPRKGQQSLPFRKNIVKEDVEVPPKQVQQPPPSGKKVVESVYPQVTKGHLPPVVEQDSASEVGIFKKIWQRWFGGNDGNCESKSDVIPEKCCNSGDISEKKSHSTPQKCRTSGDSSKTKKVEEKSVKPRSQDAVPLCSMSFSSSNNESALDDKTATGDEAYGEKSSTGPGFLNRLVNWCKVWRSSQNSNGLGDQTSDRLNQINSHSQKHEVFSKDSFWRDMETFMDSPRGSVLVSNSRTREHMAQNLQKDGPLALGSLTHNDLLYLVDLLISEKKWVRECPSHVSPFELTRPIGKSSCSSHSRANGLRSIFLGTPSQSDLQGSPEHDCEKKFQNISHAGVSSPVIKKKPSGRCRSEILTNCQKLLDEILKDYPEGFNVAIFKKKFLERYGYPLDVQSLGYEKLSSLLQIMPGVKIEFSYIIPYGKISSGSGLETAELNIKEYSANYASLSSDSEVSDSPKKDDYFDSQWEELGPVANTEAGTREARNKERRKMYPDYEPSLSDDEFSGSEGETSNLTQPEEQGKSGMNEVDSSLLQILDSWYSSKEGDNKNDKSENVDGMVDCSMNSSEPSGLPAVGIKSEISSRNYVRNRKPQKTYSFVADSTGNNKDKLIEGILGSLKKSGESKMQS